MSTMNVYQYPKRSAGGLRMQAYGCVVRGVARRDNCNDIVAGATVIKAAGLQGIDALLIMAAVVEMVEPTP